MGAHLAYFAGLLVAYAAGWFSFKVRTRWCSQCGTVKSCPRCANWVALTAPAIPTTAAHAQTRTDESA